jgi:hypothetical protein
MSQEPDAIVVDEEPMTPTTGDERPPGRHRARSIIASVLGVLAVLLLVVGLVGVWAKVTVLRSEAVADLVGDAIAQPDVQAALATYLADEAQRAVDLQAKVESLLPAQLDRFAPTITAGANAAVERVLGRVLASPQAQDAIKTIVERAHTRAMQLLRGDGLADGINVDNGQVSINLLPLIARGLTAIQSAGLLDDVKIPEITADGDPDQQIAELSAALGRDLPADFGQLVVYQSESVKNAQAAVETAQNLLVVARRALVLVIILTVVLSAATILVAPRRVRATLVLALGMAAAMVLLRSAAREVVSQAGDIATTAGAKAATTAIVGGAANSLKRLAGVLLVLSLLVVTAAVLYRRRWRDDLVLVAAVLVGVSTVALIGVNLGGLITGLVIGVAIPFVAHWAFPGRRPPPTTTAPPTASPPTAPPSTVAVP